MIITLESVTVVVQLLSCVQFFRTPWTAAPQFSLSFTISLKLFKLISIESVMPSNHLTPFSSSSQSFPASGSFQWVSSSHQVAKLLELQLQATPSNEYTGLISFRIDWFHLLAVQGTLKSLLQHHSLKASVLQCSAFFMVQLSHPRLLEKP